LFPSPAQPARRSLAQRRAKAFGAVFCKNSDSTEGSEDNEGSLPWSYSIRIHFLANPLERDEGEYAYAGQPMLEKISPYRLAHNMKFPGDGS
jgi:hypothetical protein